MGGDGFEPPTLSVWAEHLTRTAAENAGGGASAEVGALHVEDGGLAAAQSQALRLCAERRLHQAVRAMCMAATRRGALSPVHLTLLSEAGTRFASRHDRSQLEEWIRGFQG